METAILARIAELEKAREQIVEQANHSITSINGGIEELRLLLAPKTEPVPTQVAEIIEAPAA